jgi:hypothetical protein
MGYTRADKTVPATSIQLGTGMYTELRGYMHRGTLLSSIVGQVWVEERAFGRNALSRIIRQRLLQSMTRVIFKIRELGRNPYLK